MGGQELSIKFSNDIYATKQDVRREMKTNLVDGIWSEILKYRSNFNNILTLRHIDSTAYFVCLTPSIANRINSFERRLLHFVKQYSDLERMRCDSEFDFISKTNLLETIGKIYGIDTNKGTLYSIANGSLNNVTPEQMILGRYVKCIDEITVHPLKEIDDITIGDFYSTLLGNDDLTEYYRTKDFENKFSKYVTGRVYLGVPHKVIEKSMDQLLNFIQYSEESPIIVALSAYYYIYYVKPFETHNEEIATLMLKKILSYRYKDKVCAFLNFESLLSNKEEMEQVIFECQRTYDLTYFISYCLNKANKMLDDALNDIVTAQNTGLRHDFYQADPILKEEFNQQPRIEGPQRFFEEPKVEEKVPLRQEELNVEFPKNEDTIAQFFQDDPVKVEEKNEPQVQTIIPQTFIQDTKPQEVVQTFAHETVAQNAGSSVNFGQNIAISNLPTGLTEEEAAKLENHLLESNPNLSRGQAYFYARHCTIGMCYTISQYKKEVGCAYETARCSMDHLVSLGYYAKKQLKNKYIYTPVKRG